MFRLLWQGFQDEMADSDWAELMGDTAGTKQAVNASKEAPAIRASTKAPPPGFEKPLDDKPQSAAAAAGETQPAAAGGSDSKSFGGGNAALAALMGSAQPVAAAADSSAQVRSPALFELCSSLQVDAEGSVDDMKVECFRW